MPTKSLGSTKPTVIIRKKRPSLPSSGVTRLQPEASPAPSRQPLTVKAKAPRSSRQQTEQPLTPASPPAPSTTASQPPVAQSPTRKEREAQHQRDLRLLLQQRWPNLF